MLQGSARKSHQSELFPGFCCLTLSRLGAGRPAGVSDPRPLVGRGACVAAGASRLPELPSALPCVSVPAPPSSEGGHC